MYSIKQIFGVIQIRITAYSVIRAKLMPIIKNWSLKYHSCVVCGTNEEKHVALGLCVKCYRRFNEERQKSQETKKGSGKILTKKYLIDQYALKRKSLCDIAKDCHCTRQWVYKKMKQYDIALRSLNSARQIAMDQRKLSFKRVDDQGNEKRVYLRKTIVNDNFFSNWSNEMAYVLGFIYTDGTLSKSIPRVKIGQKEPEILYKIRTLMDCNAKIYFSSAKMYRTGIAGEIFSLCIYNERIYKDLCKYGLTPNKSLNIRFPDMPKEHIRHFIRGCWDGDGSVYIDKSETIRAKFISGSFDFIEGIVDALTEVGFEQRKIFTLKRKNPLYYFQILENECIKFFHYLYDNVTSEQYLERKHEVFRKAFGVLLK